MLALPYMEVYLWIMILTAIYGNEKAAPDDAAVYEERTGLPSPSVYLFAPGVTQKGVSCQGGQHGKEPCTSHLEGNCHWYPCHLL